MQTAKKSAKKEQNVSSVDEKKPVKKTSKSKNEDVVKSKPAVKTTKKATKKVTTCKIDEQSD